MKDGMDVHVERFHPLFWREIKEPAVDWTTGRMNQDIDGSELSFGFADATSGFAGLAAVGLNEFTAPAEFGDSGLCRAGFVIEPASDDGDIGAFAREELGSGGADASGSA